ncbi:MAG: DsbA family protein [Candidatus Doudnabacteria bacterium]|nr:DsbA family protein [Candidatus Doudnabacteria bacterium]
MNVRKYAWIISIALSTATLIVSAYTFRLVKARLGSLDQATAVKQPKEFAETLTGQEPVLGNQDAALTIFEFADFQCPYCKRFFDNSLPEIKRDYLDTGKVKLVFINLPFLGKESTDAAEAAWCAHDQGAFWRFHDELYRRQGAENSGAFSQDRLRAVAQDLTLDLKAFDDCLGSDKNLASIQRQAATASDFGIAGTPTFFISNEVIRGAQPTSVIRQVLDALVK